MDNKGEYRIFSVISAVLIFFQHPSTPRLYWRLRLYFFNQYIHTKQEEIHARYYACRIDFHQDRANNRDCAYNVSKGAHSVLVLETVLVMETCAYNREYTVCIKITGITYCFPEPTGFYKLSCFVGYPASLDNSYYTVT